MKIPFVISFTSLIPINVKRNIDHINTHTGTRPCIYEHFCKIIFSHRNRRTHVRQAQNSSVFRILILRVPSVNSIFLLRLLTADAISLFLNITGAIAPVAPVLNTPLRGTSILGEVRNVEISRVTQQLLCSKVAPDYG